MVPVSKNFGEKSIAKNYRPVSLLSVAHKIFGKLVNNSVVDHLKKCRPTRSTADLLTVVCDRIARFFNRFEANRAVAHDMSQVFDRV